MAHISIHANACGKTGWNYPERLQFKQIETGALK
jgi:hypothetical protein